MSGEQVDAPCAGLLPPLKPRVTARWPGRGAAPHPAVAIMACWPLERRGSLWHPSGHTGPTMDYEKLAARCVIAGIQGPTPTAEELDLVRRGIGGVILYSPLRLRIRPRKFREPDLLLLLDARDPRRQDRYWLGADLVVEIVSPDKPERDLVEKRFDYAEGGIPEYWIVNPLDQTITVLRLDGDEYAEHGVFRRGEQATSALLADFSVAVSAVFDAR